MKLQEKFEQAPEVYNSNFEIIKGYEKIADDFAIGFAEWTWNNELIVINGTTTFISKYNIYTRNELLLKYKIIYTL